MSRKRITLYRREKKPKKRDRKGWRELPIETHLKALFASALIMALLASLLWLSGIFDFTAERGHRKATTCGALFTLTPDDLESTGLCVAYNLAPFAIIPGIILFLLIRRILKV